jgi:hypothetical protein
MRIPQLRFDAEGQVVDTVGWWIRRTQASEALPGTVTVGQNEISMLPAGLFQGQRRTVVAGDTIVLDPDSPASAAPGTMSVTLIHENGDTAFAQRYRYTPTPVLPSVADSTVAAYVSAFQRLGTTAVDVEAQVRTQLRIPPSFYPVTLVRRPGEETVWLQREDPGTGSARWTVLDGEGNLLGEAHLPALAVIQVYTGDFLWAVVRDAVGAPYVIRYRVERAEVG